MACDLFCSASAKGLLKDKCIYFFGDSNIRALYKDLLWLIESGTLIADSSLKTKNEESFANDVRVSNGTLHSGRNYIEDREYKENPFIRFQFITRLFLQEFIDQIMNINHSPDYVIISSCLWDLSRWGVNGVQQFKANLAAVFDFLKSRLPSTCRIIWLTAFPPSFDTVGGFLTREIDFLRSVLPWHMVFANQYAASVAKQFEIDVLDMHYHFRFLLDYHTKDGIHWCPAAIRFATNLLLTHIALTEGVKLPGVLQVNEMFLLNSQAIFKPMIQTYIAFDGTKGEKLTNNVNVQKSYVPSKITTKQAVSNRRRRNERRKQNKLRAIPY